MFDKLVNELKHSLGGIKFEYKIIVNQDPSTDEHALNKAAGEGWILAFVNGSEFIMHRPVIK